MRPWPRHSIGEIITEHEYNKLPFEIKKHGNFECVTPPVEAVPIPVAEPVNIDQPVDAPETDLKIPITIDVLKSRSKAKNEIHSD